MIVTNCHDAYFSLMESNPSLFAASPIFPIVTDEQIICEFEKNTGKTIGVLYQSPYSTLVVDLIDGKDGLFAYERIIPTASGRGVVCVPVLNGKLLLLNQYRHSIRAMQLGFPRGFGENDLTSEENAKKELFEETGAQAIDCTFLGSITADSGLLGSVCDVYLLGIESYDESLTTESIFGFQLLSLEKFEEKISLGQINDGFTLSAYSLFKTANLDF